MIRRAILEWLDEGRWVRRTAPPWVFCAWALITLFTAACAVALVAGAIAGLCALLGNS